MTITTNITPDLPQLDFINENGRVRASVRNKLNNATLNLLLGLFEEGYTVPNASGGISIMQGIDTTTGAAVYTHIALKTNTKSPSIDMFSGKTKSTVGAIVPNIFE